MLQCFIIRCENKPLQAYKIQNMEMRSEVPCFCCCCLSVIYLRQQHLLHPTATCK